MYFAINLLFYLHFSSRIFLSTYLFIFFYLSIFIYYLFFYLSIYLFIYFLFSIFSSISYFLLSIFIYLSIYLSIYLFNFRLAFKMIVLKNNRAKKKVQLLKSPYAIKMLNTKSSCNNHFRAQLILIH